MPSASDSPLREAGIPDEDILVVEVVVPAALVEHGDIAAVADLAGTQASEAAKRAIYAKRGVIYT